MKRFSLEKWEADARKLYNGDEEKIQRHKNAWAASDGCVVTGSAGCGIVVDKNGMEGFSDPDWETDDEEETTTA